MTAPTPLPALLLTGAGLALESVEQAAHRRVAIRLDPLALERVARIHYLAQRVPTAYGRTTGVGALATQAVNPDRAGTLSLRLLRSHAAGTGPALPDRVVRAGLVVRANQLLAARSGINPTVVQALVDAASGSAVPVVKSLGGIGTADLTALAEIGLALLGEGRWTGSPPPPIPPLGPGEGLALLSSNAVTLARVALALCELRRLLTSADAVAGLSASVLAANPEAFDPRAFDGRPHPIQAEVAVRIRAVLGPDPCPPRRIQDPYPLRCIPQVHGAALWAFRHARGLAETECNGGGENPLYLEEPRPARPGGDGRRGPAEAAPPGSEAGRRSGAGPGSARPPGEQEGSRREDDTGPAAVAVHHGGFLPLSLTLALDQLLGALVSVGLGSTGRLGLLVDPSHTGLRPFLADAEDGSSGVMLAEYSAQASLARLRWAATPASPWPVTVSLSVESLASWLPLAAEQLEMAVGALAQVLGCELLAATRAARQRNAHLSDVAGAMTARAAELIGDDDADQPLGPMLDRLAAAVAEGLGGLPGEPGDQARSAAGLGS